LNDDGAASIPILIDLFEEEVKQIKPDNSEDPVHLRVANFLFSRYEENINEEAANLEKSTGNLFNTKKTNSPTEEEVYWNNLICAIIRLKFCKDVKNHFTEIKTKDSNESEDSNKLYSYNEPDSD
jgi:hypothetical protein